MCVEWCSFHVCECTSHSNDFSRVELSLEYLELCMFNRHGVIRKERWRNPNKRMFKTLHKRTRSIQQTNLCKLFINFPSVCALIRLCKQVLCMHVVGIAHWNTIQHPNEMLMNFLTLAYNLLFFFQCSKLSPNVSDVFFSPE